MKNSLPKTAFLSSIILSICLFSPPILAMAAHPIDPLSADEIESAVKILKAMRNFPKEILFSTVQLNEPPKAEVWNYKTGTPFRREAFAIVMDRPRNKTFEATIDLRAKKSFRGKNWPAFNR